MILTTYKVATPHGLFEAHWDEDEEIPVSYTGDEGAIAFFKAFLDLGAVSGRGGALIQFDTLEPADLYGFCQSEKYGITVLATGDDLVEEIEDEQPNMNVILDAASDAEAFVLIGEGAEILSRLDEGADSFFADLGRLREIIQALGGEQPEPAPAVDPLASARARIEGQDFASLTRDFMRSLSVIKGLDEGTERGWDRSLFVNSITGKMKTQAKNDPELAGILLAWLAIAQSKFAKPAITPRNSMWQLVEGWAQYKPLFRDEEAEPAPEPAPDPAPEPEPTPEPTPTGKSAQFESYRAAIEKLLADGQPVPSGMLEQIRADDRLEDGEDAELLAIAGAVTPTPEPEPEPQPNEPSMEDLIKIAADSIEKLRRVDVYRVLDAAGAHRADLAGFIVANRSDLAEEVTTVMAEEWPDVTWGVATTEKDAPVPPTGGVPAELAPENPERTADMEYLRSVAAKSVDMWADDLADKLEAIVAKYPGDADLEAAWREAVNAYTNFMVENIAKAA